MKKTWCSSLSHCSSDIRNIFMSWYFTFPRIHTEDANKAPHLVSIPHMILSMSQQIHLLFWASTGSGNEVLNTNVISDQNDTLLMPGATLSNNLPYFEETKHIPKLFYIPKLNYVLSKIVLYDRNTLRKLNIFDFKAVWQVVLVIKA